jgi:hypothetical protein
MGPIGNNNNNNNNNNENRLEKCARISLKNGTVYGEDHIGNTMENKIKN